MVKVVEMSLEERGFLEFGDKLVKIAREIFDREHVSDFSNGFVVSRDKPVVSVSLYNSKKCKVRVIDEDYFGRAMVFSDRYEQIVGIKHSVTLKKEY